MNNRDSIIQLAPPKSDLALHWSQYLEAVLPIVCLIMFSVLYFLDFSLKSEEKRMFSQARK